MGDPVTMALGAQVGSSIFGGLSGAAEAKGEKQRAEANAYIGRTRAIQTDTDARQGLNDELATMRATFATNDQKPGVGTLAIFNELRSSGTASVGSRSAIAWRKRQIGRCRQECRGEGLCCHDGRYRRGWTVAL